MSVDIHQKHAVNEFIQIKQGISKHALQGSNQLPTKQSLTKIIQLL